MTIKEIEAAVEAILFTMGDSVETEKIAVATGQDVETTRKIIHNMMDRYESERKGIRIIELEDSFQMCTRPEFYEYLIRVAKQPKKYVLTDVMLETLAIIAYRQPVTRLEIEKIRGVKSDHAVKKLVEYGRFPYRALGRRADAAEDERMVRWALETTGLSEFACQPVSSLSGGQAQRVWIAMALAQGSKVLLLDEPTTYLDVRYQLDILRLVRRLNEEFGMTIVMVLHDINQALHYSDEVVALADGRIVAQGAPERIVTSELLEQVYGISLRVVDVDGKPFVLEV